MPICKNIFLAWSEGLHIGGVYVNPSGKMLTSKYTGGLVLAGLLVTHFALKMPEWAR